MIPVVPLWAQGVDELLMIAVVIVIIVISVVGQMIARLRRPQQPRGGLAQPRRPVGGRLEEQIEAFLRRAAGQRGVEQPRPAGAGAEPLAPAERPVQAEVVGEEPLGSRIRERVKEDLNTGNFARRASQLGDRVAQADEQLDQRLHQVFDHEVSRLAGSPGESAAAPGVEEPTSPEDRLGTMPPTAAAGLAALLSNAQSVRQAIVINEILRRPEDRWG